MTYLGIDIGTSAVKALLVDEAQAVLAEAAVPVATARPQPGWSEQEAEAGWQASEAAVTALRRAVPAAFAAVRGIGLAGQMHGALLLDAAGVPVRPAILWNDGRAAAECAAIAAAVPDIEALAGVAAMPGLTAPKLLWLKRHEPESLARAATILLAKDFVRLKLTGEIATDVSDAAGTLLLDEAARDWSARLAAAAGLAPEQLPPLLEASAPAGTLRPAVAAAWGLPAGVVVAAGGGDTPTAALGIGAVGDGDAIVNLGTSGQILVSRDRYQPTAGSLIHGFAHALPGRWYQMAALLNGASCLDFAARLVGGGDIGALLAAAEAGYRGPGRLLFLPYLAGERTPLDDPDARGVLFGLDPESRPADVVRAVLEGVAYALMDAQGALQAGGTGIAAAAATGGGARSRFWLRLVAAALGVPVRRHEGGDAGAAFGAARLARLAVTGEAPEAVCGKPAVAEEIAPDPALRAQFAEGFPRFRSLYRALRPEFGKMPAR